MEEERDEKSNERKNAVQKKANNFSVTEKFILIAL